MQSIYSLKKNIGDRDLKRNSALVITKIELQMSDMKQEITEAQNMEIIQKTKLKRTNDINKT